MLEASGGEYVSGRRIGRLLTIWLAWYGIYLLVSVLLGKFDKRLTDSFGAMLLVGPAIHLWYLPFLAAILLMSTKLALIISRPALLVLAGAAYALAMVLVDGWRAASMGLGVPWAQYVHALPAIIVGMLFAGLKPRELSTRVSFVVFALAATIPAWSVEGVGVTYFCGVLLATPILLGWQSGQLVDRISSLSKYMLGIYLIHPLVIRFVRRAMDVDGILLAVPVFLVSLAIVAALYQRAPRLARLVM